MGNQHGKGRRSHGKKIDWERAEKPSSPGKPYLVPDCEERESDFITIRWAPPISDGGAPILGYVVEHRRTGSPHWLRAIPHLAEEAKLTLTGLEPGWRYQFRVSAENGMGRSPPGEISEVLTVTSQKTAATSPHFNVELRDTIALENEKVEFVTHVVAIPQAKISWYKDGFEIFSSRRMKIITENDQSTLIIHQAALEDEGEIKCTATNRAGHSVTKAILKLEAPPRIRLPRQYEDGLLFEKGELMRLKVSTAGKPSPTITWYHDGEPLHNSERYEIENTARSSTLKINEAQRDDRGEYHIRGVNKIGEDMASFLVTVTDRPQPPGKAKVVMALGRSVTLSWTSPSDDGGCRIGSYIVEYFRVGWDMWLKAATCRQLTTVLSELIEGSEYRFRVKAENPYGMSDPSEESDLVFIPDPKRGILTPLPKTEARPVDTWLNNVKAASDDEQSKKVLEQRTERRKILEENARKLLDTPPSVLLSPDNTSTKPEILKRDREDIEESIIPPPVPKRRHKKDKQRSTASSPSEPIDSSNSKLSEWSSSSFCEPEETSQSLKAVEKEPLHLPREKDHIMFHGSSELMLVLLPQEEPRRQDLTAQRISEIEMSLAGSGIAPPMSLSAPELGTGEKIEMPGMREAVSSTELLHERAIARLYQDSIEEEAQRAVKRRYSTDRKSVERRFSLRDGTLLERRHSFKERATSERKETRPEVASKDENSEATNVNSGIGIGMQTALDTTFDDTGKKKSPATSVDMVLRSPSVIERESSVEREEMEFASVRERIRLKNEQNLRHQSSAYRPAITRQRVSSGSSSYTISSEEYDETMEDEETEEDYLDEEEEEDNDVIDKEELMPLQNLEFHCKAPKRSILQNHETQSKRLAPYAEEEDDTCLPVTSRILLPKLEITLAPPIESAEEAAENKPTPTQISFQPEREERQEEEKASVGKGKKRAAKILRKLGLKREKKFQEIVVEVDSSAPSSPVLLPKPILKNKPVLKKKGKEKKAYSSSDQLGTSCDEALDERSTVKRKKQVRIAEPSEETAKLIPTPVEKSKRLSDEDQANKVLICHYSDIVREFGRGKKATPKQCLSCEELKAAAGNGSNQELRLSPVRAEDLAEPIVKDSKAVDTDITTIRKPRASMACGPLAYLTDAAIFMVACWLYLFSNELYAVPLLCLVAYRQVNDAIKKRYASFAETISTKFKKKKMENG